MSIDFNAGGNPAMDGLTSPPEGSSLLLRQVEISADLMGQISSDD